MTTETNGKENGSSPASKSGPTIHIAECESGAGGGVLWGEEIAKADAIKHRAAGLDIVVRGSDKNANKRLARAIESGVGQVGKAESPHTNAGPHSLPHFHTISRDPLGHSFYETENRKAKRMR